MVGTDRLFGPLDPAADAGYPDAPPRMGFFTDTSVCIGCKACEVACKEWNGVPADGLNLLGMSFDNTGALSANSWRHVAFIEQQAPTDVQAPGEERVRWLMSSDVCKHCTHAACLDVCPTGALFRTEFGTVVVQADVCNGCGSCIPACPYGVIDQREGDGRAWKCTLCYDRIGDGLMPACATACPTESIQYGPLDELRERAERRVEHLHEVGAEEARLYGHDPRDGVGGDGAFFLLLDEPEVYGLPPDPVVTTRDLPAMWRRAGLAAGGLAAGCSLLAAGADLTGRPAMRRAGRLVSLGALGASAGLLVSDLGRPDRFYNMLRLAKPTSPMSIGSWILATFGPPAGVAAIAEFADRLPRRGVLGLARRVLPPAGRAAGLAAAGVAPALATYTAVLIADTAAPSWHEAYPELPFVFAGSALASASGV